MFANFLPRFKDNNFFKRTLKLRYFAKKNAKFSNAPAPKTAPPPIANFRPRACHQGRETQLEREKTWLLGETQTPNNNFSELE